MSHQQAPLYPRRMISGEIVAATDAAALADRSLNPDGLLVEFGPSGHFSDLLALALAVGSDHHAVFELASFARVTAQVIKAGTK